MAIIYAVVEESGAINGTYSSPFEFIPCGEDVGDTTHYVDMSTKEIKAKRPLEIHQDIEGLVVTLTGPPAGVTVETNNMHTVTDDEPLVITYDVPGTYHIALAGHVEYLDKTLEVSVGDA